MNHHPLKKLNLHTNIANNLRMSMYNTNTNTNTVNNNIPNSTIINDPTYHRLFTRKTTHSLDKINRGNHVHIDTSNFQKQLLNATTSPTAKKLTSYQSTKNIHRNNSINNNTANPNDLSFSPTRQHLNNYTTVMNHSSLGGNNTINNSTNNINNYTQSNINTTNQNKIKERLIQNLKNNFNQERIRRKKMLSVNVNVNLNQHYSMIHNNINDSVNNNNTNNNNTTTVNESVSNYTQSYYDSNSNTVGNVNLYKRNYFAKKDQPLKLYTDANAFNNNTQGSNKKSNGDNSSSNSNCNYGEGFRNRKLINSKSNHNLSLSTNNNNKHHGNSSSNNNVIVNSMETFYDLELKMDKMLKENKSNSKSKKYNITKMIFEEGIKQFTILISNLLTNYPTTSSTHGYSNSMNYTSSSSNHYMENNNIIITFLRNILKVYHESFLAYSNENKTLRDKVDKLQSSSYQLDKKVNDYSKQIKEKENEITSLKSQITKLSLSLSTKDKDKDKETITNIIKPTTTITNPNNNNNSTSLKTSSQIMPTDPRQVTFSAADDDLINSSVTPITKHQEMIKDLNTKNINDLDALYFNDKVEMAESNRDISPTGGGHVVPKLNFGVMGSDLSSSSTMCGVGLANVHFNVPKIINNVYLKKN